jgi:hypothetical protein
MHRLRSTLTWPVWQFSLIDTAEIRVPGTRSVSADLCLTLQENRRSATETLILLSASAPVRTSAWFRMICRGQYAQPCEKKGETCSVTAFLMPARTCGRRTRGQASECSQAETTKTGFKNFDPPKASRGQAVSSGSTQTVDVATAVRLIGVAAGGTDERR